MTILGGVVAATATGGSAVAAQSPTTVGDSTGYPTLPAFASPVTLRDTEGRAVAHRGRAALYPSEDLYPATVLYPSSAAVLRGASQVPDRAVLGAAG